jgi:transcriptional regulator with XRE-family HTH domain
MRIGALLTKPSKLLGHNLGMAIKARGITQHALAALSGVGRTQLSRYVSGHKCPNVDNLAAIAIALGVSIDALLGITVTPPPAPPRDPTKEEIAAFILKALG